MAVSPGAAWALSRDWRISAAAMVNDAARKKKDFDILFTVSLRRIGPRKFPISSRSSIRVTEGCRRSRVPFKGQSDMPPGMGPWQPGRLLYNEMHGEIAQAIPEPCLHRSDGLGRRVPPGRPNPGCCAAGSAARLRHRATRRTAGVA